MSVTIGELSRLELLRLNLARATLQDAKLIGLNLSEAKLNADETHALFEMLQQTKLTVIVTVDNLELLPKGVEVKFVKDGRIHD